MDKYTCKDCPMFGRECPYGYTVRSIDPECTLRSRWRRAEEKADLYQSDWMSSKYDFGVAMARSHALTAKWKKAFSVLRDLIRKDKDSKSFKGLFTHLRNTKSDKVES